MTLPSVNAIGGTLAAVALAVVLFFGVRQVVCPTQPTASTVVVAPAPQVLKPPVAKSDTSPTPPAPAPKPKVYRKVLKGGKLGAKVDCTWVPSVAHQFSKDQVLAAAKEYGLSPAQISALRVCLH